MSDVRALHGSDPFIGRRFQGQYGERTVLSRQGDRYVLTMPGTPLNQYVQAAEIERFIQVEEAQARSALACAQRREAAAAQQAAETFQPYRVFAATFPPMQGGKVRAALEKVMRRRGEILPRHAITEQLLAEGGVLSTDRQRIDLPGGAFMTPDVLTKTAFDYAAWLSEPVSVWRLERCGLGPVALASLPQTDEVSLTVRGHLVETGQRTVQDIAGDRSPHWYSACLNEADLEAYFSGFWTALLQAGFRVVEWRAPRRALRFAPGEVAFDHRLASRA